MRKTTRPTGRNLTLRHVGTLRISCDNIATIQGRSPCLCARMTCTSRADDACISAHVCLLVGLPRRGCLSWVSLQPVRKSFGTQRASEQNRHAVSALYACIDSHLDQLSACMRRLVCTHVRVCCLSDLRAHGGRASRLSRRQAFRAVYDKNKSLRENMQAHCMRPQ